MNTEKSDENASTADAYSHVRPTSVSYDAALDGWRAISILLVLTSHGGMKHLIPGGLGVTVFFFISGFLITSLLLTEFEREHNISLKKFFLRRFWRLFPPVFVYIGISTGLIVLLNGEISPYEPIAALLYFANYYSILWGVSPISGVGSPLNILGSLAVEEHYYIFFAPVVAILAYTRLRLLGCLVLLLIVPLMIRCWIIFSHDIQSSSINYVYMATETRIDSIAWGALLAWLCHYINAKNLDRFLDNNCSLVASFCIFIFCLLYRAEWFRESFRYSLQGIAMMPLFYSSLKGSALSVFKKVLGNSILVFIGRISYSIYLYHWLAIMIANAWFGTESLSIRWLVTFYSLSLVFSYASFCFLEIPSLIFRQRYGSHAVR